MANNPNAPLPRHTGSKTPSANRDLGVYDEGQITRVDFSKIDLDATIRALETAIKVLHVRRDQVIAENGVSLSQEYQRQINFLQTTLDLFIRVRMRRDHPNE